MFIPSVLVVEQSHSIPVALPSMLNLINPFFRQVLSLSQSPYLYQYNEGVALYGF